MPTRYNHSKALRTFLLPIFFLFPAMSYAGTAFLVKTLELKDEAGTAVTLETCSVFADRLEIRKVFGINEDRAPVFSALETLNVAVDSSISDAIARAFSESLDESDNDLCGGSRSQILAYNSEGAPLVIYSSGGCGEKRMRRDGVNSSALRKFILSYCPTL